MKIIFATNNDHKLKELKYILRNLNIEILGLNDINYNKKIIENGITFNENAKKKANIIFEETKMPTIADDSGLSINVLNGYPGIYTSLFLKNEKQKIKNICLLNFLKNIPKKERGAKYICSIYFIKNKKEIFCVEKTCKGEIAENFYGENGFGFDPIFYIKKYKKTMAEISFSKKNKISHRAKAINCFKKYLLNN